MLSSRVERELRHHVIPFWRSLRDSERGGYFGYKDHDGTVDPTADKATLLISRILWFFSTAATQLNDPELLEEARHAYLFLTAKCIDQVDSGVFWSVTCDGQPSDTTKHSYVQAFAIYGLAAYYEASGDEAALAQAQGLCGVLEGRCRSGRGYGEAYDRHFQPIENDKLSENGVSATHTMNTLLHVFEAYAGLYQASPNADLEEALRRITTIFETTVYNPERHRLEVFFDEQMKTLLDLHSFGHDIEASWLIDWGVGLLGDPELTARTSKWTSALAAHVYQEGFRDGSVMYESVEGVVDTNRHWWVQVEAMLGFWHAWEKNPSAPQADNYLAAVGQLWDYIEDNFIDHRPGREWWWMVDETRTPVPGWPIASVWKCPYHSGRACLNLMRQLPASNAAPTHDTRR